MKHLILLSIIFFLPRSPVLAVPQQALSTANSRGTVESAEISGIDSDEVSDEIHQAIHQLAGKPFDLDSANELVVRIQAEDPAFTAKIQISDGRNREFVKVVFVVEKEATPKDGGDNVNSRY